MAGSRTGLRIALIAALVLGLILAGCGGGGGGQLRLFLVRKPSGMEGGKDGSWSISITTNAPPYIITWNMGGGADPNTGTVSSEASPAIIKLKMLNPSTENPETYTYSFTVSDNLGNFRTAGGTYVVKAGDGSGPPVDPPVDPPGGNEAPVIDETQTLFDSETKLMYIAAVDPNGDEMAVELDVPAGLRAEPVPVGDREDNVIAIYQWSVAGLFLEGTTATAGITVSDPDGLSDEFEVDVEFDPVTLAENTLYAVPVEQTVEVGSPETVLVITGPLGNPFQFMAAVGLETNSDGELDEASFNVGELGGEQYDADGVWEDVAYTSLGIPPVDIAGPSTVTDGRKLWTFKFKPQGGVDINDAVGPLFNAAFTFTEPGLKTLSFRQSWGGVNRTYFQRGDSRGYFWDDITNDHEGIPSTFTVVEAQAGGEGDGGGESTGGGEEQ